MSLHEYNAVDQHERGKLDPSTDTEIHSRNRKWSLSQIVLLLLGFAAVISLLSFGFHNQRGPKRDQITASLLAPKNFVPDCENTCVSNLNHSYLY